MRRLKCLAPPASYTVPHCTFNLRLTSDSGSGHTVNQSTHSKKSGSSANHSSLFGRCHTVPSTVQRILGRYGFIANIRVLTDQWTFIQGYFFFVELYASVSVELYPSVSMELYAWRPSPRFQLTITMINNASRRQLTNDRGLTQACKPRSRSLPQHTAS